MASTKINREQWLERAVRQVAPLFKAHGHDLPTVRVSVGWPGGRSNRQKTIGQCWKPAAAADGTAQLFISPILDDAVRVLDVLVHELVHAVNFANGDDGHGRAFAAIAKPLGLEGKMTQTVAGAELTEKLAKVAEKLGEYPHAALNPSLSGVKKQTTRMLKVVCGGGCGGETPYTVRMTRKWLDELGEPFCPSCGCQMIEV